MSQPYVGEIRMFAGNFPPNGWMLCSGQLIAISDYETLFNLIGTTYGGDGVTTFALPDLQGRFPMHFDNLYPLAQTGGTESETLTLAQIPVHNHPAIASTLGGNSDNPSGNFWAANSARSFGNDVPAVTLGAGIVQATGGSQPHDNMHPFLAINFIISLFGIFPSQT